MSYKYSQHATKCHVSIRHEANFNNKHSHKTNNMKREEIYEAIDELHEEVNKLKGEFIALTDEELWSIKNAKIENAFVQIHKYIEHMRKLSVDIQKARSL